MQLVTSRATFGFAGCGIALGELATCEPHPPEGYGAGIEMGGKGSSCFTVPSEEACRLALGRILDEPEQSGRIMACCTPY